MKCCRTTTVTSSYLCLRVGAALNAWLLVRSIHWIHMREYWEAGIDQSDKGSHDVTNVDCLGVVAFWHAERWSWHNLLPTQAHVCAENSNSTKIEQAPSKGLKDF